MGKLCWNCYRHFGLSSRLSVKPEPPTGTGWISQGDVYTLPAQEAHQQQHTLTYTRIENVIGVHTNHIHVGFTQLNT